MYAFAVRCLDSIISLVSIPKISSLYIASVTAQAGLSLLWLQTLKTGLLVTWLKYEPSHEKRDLSGLWYEIL